MDRLTFRDYPDSTLRTFALYAQVIGAYPGDDGFALWVCRTYPYGAVSLAAARERYSERNSR